MNAVRSFVAEVVGLFVEDGFFALAIAGWLAVAGAMATLQIGSPEVRGAALFVGLAAILVGGIVRGAHP